MYCNEKCQKKDWKAVHRRQCKELQQVFVPPPPGWGEAAAAAAGGGGGGGGGAAASTASAAAADGSGGGGGGAAAAAAAGGGVANGDDEFENPCPFCLDNEDDAYVDGNQNGMCSACGQFYCGACSTLEGMGQMQSPNCPTCRAPMHVSEKEQFKRLLKLVYDKSSGRHTSVAQ